MGYTVNIMIEAVNSTLQASQIVRPAQDSLQQDSEPVSIDIERERNFAQAPYISPAVDYNLEFDRAVLVLRDSATGEVTDQIPSDSRLEAQARATADSFSFEAPQVRPEAAAPFSDNRSQSSSSQSIDVPQQDVQVQQVERSQEAASVQQIAAFETAARSGNTNAGSVTLFA